MCSLLQPFVPGTLRLLVAEPEVCGKARGRRKVKEAELWGAKSRGLKTEKILIQTKTKVIMSTPRSIPLGHTAFSWQSKEPCPLGHTDYTCTYYSFPPALSTFPFFHPDKSRQERGAVTLSPHLCSQSPKQTNTASGCRARSFFPG